MISPRCDWSNISARKICVNNWGARKLNKEVPCHHFGLDGTANTWHRSTLNIARDFEKTEVGKSYNDLQIDCPVINLGVWNINDGEEQPFGIYFTDRNLVTGSTAVSTTNGVPIVRKDIW